MEDLMIWEQHTVTLTRDPKMGFGFALSGGRDKPHPDSGDNAVVVSDIIRNGPAMGRLQTRDNIVMVNGVSMENVSANFAIQHLKSSGKTADITVKRPRTIQIPVSNRPVRAASHSNLLEDVSSHHRPRRGSDGGYGRRARSSTPDRNGHDLPIMSGFKRLPHNDVPDKPIRATLSKRRPTDEYGMKLGSQIFIKHMTTTGLAAKEGTLQEGDLVLKINGMTTENLSLLETKHLVEKSRGKLTMLVLRDDRKFLVNIPEVEDSPRNSDRDDSSSELEDISDLDADLPPPTRTSRAGRRTRRTRAEPPPPAKSRDSSPVRSTLTRPPHHVLPTRRVPSESESDHSHSPPRTRRDSPDPPDKYRTLSGISTLPNPRASPVAQNWNPPRTSSAASRPRKAVSDSDSDRSASPPARRDNAKSVDYSRYRVLPDLPPPGSRASSHQDSPRRGASPYRLPPPPVDSESESDGSSGVPRRQGTPASQDSRSRYRAPPQVAAVPIVEPPRWTAPKVPSIVRKESESEDSERSVPRRQSWSSGNSPARAIAHAETRVNSARLDSPRRSPSPYRPPADDSSESEHAPSPPTRRDNSDHDSHHSFPQVNNGTRSAVSKSNHSQPRAKPVDEPLYSLPPDALPTPHQGYSSDQNKVEFVKEGNVGLRLVGGNDIGIFVGGVQPNSPAQRQGMKEGDQILQVNGVDFGHFTREEAAMYLLNIRAGEKIDIRTQNKMDIYKKILKTSLGDSFYIRTHFDHEPEGNIGLGFTRGEVFRVVDTMHRGKLGNWLAVRMGNDLHELDKGTIPNQARAETLASLEQTQRASGDRQGSGPRAEFWKLRGLRGAKKNTRRTRDDLLQLTIQGKFPAYEKVLLREANFKRPIVILGPLNDIAMEKLAREMPDEYEIAEMVPRSGGESSSTVIKLDTVRRIAEQDKHPLLDITPTAVERLNYIQYHPMVLFLDPTSRKDVKAMRQRYSPNSNKSSRRLYSQALKMRKHYSHLFAARIDLQPNTNVWYEVLKDKIRHQQSKPVWVSEVTLEGGGDEELDALGRADATDYLSCDSRAASDYEDTDGEAYTDGEPYTDNEELDEPGQNQNEPVAQNQRYRTNALARSSEPARDQSPSPEPPAEGNPYEEEEQEEEEEDRYLPEMEVPPLLYVPEPHSSRRSTTPQQHDDEPMNRSFSDSDFSAEELPLPATPSDGPPAFRAPDPPVELREVAEPPLEEMMPPESPPHASLSAIEEKLQQTRMAEPQEKPSPSFIVLAHHEAVQWRRTQIRGSDSSEDDEDEEADDIEWGPATEL